MRTFQESLFVFLSFPQLVGGNPSETIQDGCPMKNVWHDERRGIPVNTGRE